jgi:hypothetical protein
VLVSQSMVQPTVLSPLQKGQLNWVSSFAAACNGSDKDVCRDWCVQTDEAMSCEASIVNYG